MHARENMFSLTFNYKSDFWGSEGISVYAGTEFSVLCTYVVTLQKNTVLVIT